LHKLSQIENLSREKPQVPGNPPYFGRFSLPLSFLRKQDEGRGAGTTKHFAGKFFEEVFNFFTNVQITLSLIIPIPAKQKTFPLFSPSCSFLRAEIQEREKKWSLNL